MTINDISIFVGAAVGINGLTSYWIYKVLNRMIEELRAKNAELHAEIQEIKASEIRWFKKYHAVVSIILKHRRDKDGSDCKVYKEYLKYIEGEDDL